MVLTSLKKKARPLIRFKTADIVSYTTEQCACGRTSMRLHGIHGRLDDMLIIKGVNVFPSDIEAIIRNNNNMTGEYRLRVSEIKHMTQLTVEAEYGDHIGENQLDGLAQEIQRECQKIVGIKPKIELVKPGELPRATHKAKRVIDERKSE